MPAINHDQINSYYDVVPEKHAPFNERRFNEYMFQFCNQLGLKGEEIVALEELKLPHKSYRVFYEKRER